MTGKRGYINSEDMVQTLAELKGKIKSQVDSKAKRLKDLNIEITNIEVQIEMMHREMESLRQELNQKRLDAERLDAQTEGLDDLT